MDNHINLKWKPQKDITAYEVARIFELIELGISFGDEKYKQIEPRLLRHFVQDHEAK